MRFGRRLALRALLALAVFLAVGWFGAEMYLEKRIDQEIRRKLAEVHDKVRVAWSGVDVDLLTQSLTVSGIEAAFPDGTVMTADRLRVRQADREHFPPHFLRAEISGWTLPVVPAYLGMLAPPLRLSGYKTLTLDADVDYAFDAENKLLDLRRLHFDAHDACELSLSMYLENIGFGWLQAIGTSIRSGELHYVERGLAGRLSNAFAAAAQMPREQLTGQLSDALLRDAAEARTAGQLQAAEAFTALAAFARGPADLHIRVRPTEPIPVLYFRMGRSLAEMLELLNIEISAQ